MYKKYMLTRMGIKQKYKTAIDIYAKDFWGLKSKKQKTLGD